MDKRDPRADATIQLDTSEMLDAIQLDANDGDVMVTRRSDRPGPPPLPPGSASVPPPAMAPSAGASSVSEPAGRSWKAYAIVGGLLVVSIAVGIGVGGAMRPKAGPAAEAQKPTTAAQPSAAGAAPSGSAVIVIPTVDFNDTK